MGYVQLSGFPATEAVQDEDQLYSDNATTGVEQRTTAKQLANYVIGGFAPQRQSIPVASVGQAVFSTAGYTPGLVNVFIIGLRLNPPQYQATDGVNVIITDATILANLGVGMTVDIDASVSIGGIAFASIASVQALDPGNATPITTLTGVETVLARQGQSLFQLSMSKLRTWMFTGTIQLGGSTSPTITNGTGVPTSTQPVSSIYLRTDGTAGARLYVSAGAGVWTAVATV